MKRIVVLMPLALLLTGCIGDLLSFSCEFTGDEEHCYQSAAVQESEPIDCEKVLTERFTDSNPPKDKCYLMIAENTGNPSVCDEIVGGPASYTRDGCLNSVLSNHHPNECAGLSDEVACRTVYATNGRGCGEGYEFVSGVCDPIPTFEEEEEETINVADLPLSQLSDAEKADIASLQDALGGKYRELIEQDIATAKNPSRKAGLEAYLGFLDGMKEGYDEVNSTYEDLEKWRRIFLDAYDPKNDVAYYDVSTKLDPGFMDQLKERLFGKEEPKTGLERDNQMAETSLQMYAEMLNQQADNDFMQQNLLGRLGGMVTDKVKGDLQDTVTTKVTELAQAGAGTAFGAVTAVGDALEAFQDEAQHQMFLGLARAYNRRRDALEQTMPNATDAEKHARAVQEVQQDPYRDNTQLAVVKHGNILENPDCQNDSNPLCVDNRVWWHAMNKTYNYMRDNQ